MNPFTGEPISTGQIQLVLVESMKLSLVTCLVAALCRSVVWKRTIWYAGACSLILVSTLEYFGWGQSFVLSNRIEGGEAASSSSAWQLPVVVEAHPLAFWISLAWLGGSLTLAGFFLVARYRLSQLIARCRTCPDSDLLVTADHLRRRLGISAPVHLLNSDEISTPMAAGMIRKVVVLPEGFQKQFSSDEVGAVLIHELGHHRASDPVWQFLMNVMLCVLWWNPLVWWLYRRAARDAELAADESSALIPGGPVSLASGLVKMARQMQARATASLAMTGIDSATETPRRVRRVLNLPGAILSPRPAFLLLAQILYAVSITFFALNCFR